jgi:hypothetical protein
MMKRQAVLFGFLMIAAAPVGAGVPLSVRVSPSVAFAPANLVVRTTVEADAHNRAISIEAESGEFYRSSEMQLDGDKAPRTETFEFRSLPSGVYEVKASLIGPDGKLRATARSEVNVISNGNGR